MLRQSLRKTIYGAPLRFAGGFSAKPQKVGDKTHFETVVLGTGQFLNTANVMFGAFCKANPKEPAVLISDKSRGIFHEFSKDLHSHISYKDEAATGKGIYEAPPKGVFYKIEADVQRIDADNNKLIMQDRVYTYDHLIIAGDTLFDWDKVKGMAESIKDYWNSNVTSVAQVHSGEMVWRTSLDFRGGNFVYALPKSPYKNEGTSHIFAYFDQLQLDKRFDNQWYQSKFIITTPDTFLHRVPWVDQQLVELAKKKGIEIRYNLRLEEIRYSKIMDPYRVSDAIYRNTVTGQQETINYGNLVCYPEARVPDLVKPLCDASGFVEVDKHSLAHVRYPNVFGIGEITNAPTISNCIGILPQAKVIAGNIGDLKKGMKPHYYYDGTSATPIFTGWHKLIMPGFNYNWDKVPTYLATSTTSPLASLWQSLSFLAFKRYEKKWFAKRLKGKIYGPPRWTKYVSPSHGESAGEAKH